MRYLYGSPMPNVGAANLEQHLRNRHRGVGALLGSEMAPGMLAAIQLAGGWADKSKHRLSTGAHGTTRKTGSARNDVM
ncbi:hypothetical protein Esi_0179_0033 [Ectocarpus siliculosus]|uniref:Uncharacterized protein n=1 Tax=Ectocarpus siliculosus TaxID=2880 RepID=D7FND6_ECTSI|nr:hypothetical protein Esi_0179_0033 [Ectocarpus siliculosus]|eukprot:CBJ30190.1 hypothetical protein Esi_0179_0033 [Ectocarpus siliculosus]